jgi:4-alpha-glucanotransferase
MQFKAFQQWGLLKKYANLKGIEIIGDIPIYLAYDSSDVWMHPEYFQLNENRELTHVAGVPPDGFSQDGQLWGNPLYRWDYLASNGYKFWLDRIRSKLKLYDMYVLIISLGLSIIILYLMAIQMQERVFG